MFLKILSFVSISITTTTVIRVLIVLATAAEAGIFAICENSAVYNVQILT